MRAWVLAVPVFLAVVLAAAALGEQKRSRASAAATCLGKKATIIGSARADKLTGTVKTDVIAGLGGNDRIDGRGGNDLLCGGAGTDTIQGGAGRDRADGGPGQDTCLAVETKSGCELPKPKPTEREFSAGPLAAGTYVNSTFQPNVSFKVGTGWEGRTSPGFGASTFLLLRTVGPRTTCSSVTGNQIMFTRFSPEQSVSETVARMTSISGAVPTAPVDTTVGGRSGKQFELTATGSACVTLGEIATDFTAVLDPGDRFRFYVIGGGTSPTVVVGFGGATSAFPGFQAEAEAVVASIRWR